MLLLGCAMTGASIFILLLFSASNRPEAAWGVMFGWFAVAFFGLGVCLSLALLARPQTLLLDSAGFTLAGGLIRRPLKTAWRDVERFFVYRQGFASPSHIGINFAASRAPNHWLLKYSRAVGLEGALPDGWALPTREMVARLNAYRERALASAGDPDELHVASESPASEPSNVEGENSVVFGPERCVTSARKVSFMLLLGCVFVAGSFFVTRAAGLFAIVFLAIPLLRLLWLLIRPYKLLLDGDGFTLSGGTSLKPQKKAWRDVERFLIRSSWLPSPQSVAWVCVAGRSPKKREFMSQLFAPESERADGELPDLWTLSAPELERRLNAYRARALAAQGKITK
jgi:hypothetical protein